MGECPHSPDRKQFTDPMIRQLAAKTASYSAVYVLISDSELQQRLSEQYGHLSILNLESFSEQYQFFTIGYARQWKLAVQL